MLFRRRVINSPYRHSRWPLIGRILLMAALLLHASFSLALKPEHEADRLLLATEKAFIANDYSKAQEYIDTAKRLQIKLPAKFDYFNGRLLHQKGKLEGAKSSLERYADRVGRKGEHYTEALELITQMSQRSMNRPQKNSAKAEIKWSSNDRSGDDYVSHLQMLYMADSSASALIRHINSLLDFYAYNDPRVKAGTNIGKATRHQVSNNSRGEIISSNLPLQGENHLDITEERFSVFGINPYVSYQCSNSTNSCWLLHPLDQRKWMQIVPNKKAATELAKALSELIKSMQKSG